jgi:hypothetical protein
MTVKWVDLDADKICTPHTIRNRTAFLSPYDIPEMFRVYYDGNVNEYVINFTYLLSSNHLNPKDALKDYGYVKEEEKSGRLISIHLNEDETKNIKKTLKNIRNYYFYSNSKSSKLSMRMLEVYRKEISKEMNRLLKNRNIE